MKYSIVLVSFLLAMVNEVELGVIQSTAEIIAMGAKPGTFRRSTTTTPNPTTTTVVSAQTLLPLKEVEPIVSNIAKSDKTIESQGSKPSTLQGSSTRTQNPTSTTEGSIPSTMQPSVPVKEAKPIIFHFRKTDNGIKLEGPKTSTLQGSTTATPEGTKTIKGSAPTSNVEPVKAF
ncbi:uncharacterized protein LOC134697635 [Mytilus trossulus]|uniref:uncharacterized protein LOC134697635 n=1 Tax=Mytilus trossulus TaxID=6551 RepID=UPI0030061A73